MKTNRLKFKLSPVLGGVVAAVATIAWAQNSDDALVIDLPVDRDVYAAHQEVSVQSTVNGDLVAAGRRVSVDGKVTGDILVAAQGIEIQSDVSDDVRAAGRSIRINAPITGHVAAAGETVTVDGSVGDWAWLAGNTVEVRGDIGSDLSIRASNITIDAQVTGDVDLAGDDLILGPNTVVRGDLRWRGRNDAEISPDAKIEGELIEEPLPDFAEKVRAGRGLSFTLTVIVAVMILYLLFSRALRASSERIAKRPAVSLVLGFAVMTGMPVLAIILIFSPLDAWFGFAVLGIYTILLFLSVLTGLFAISDLTLRRFRSQPAKWQALTAIFVTVVLVGLLAQVPYLGLATVLIIWLLGIGALCWGIWVGLQSYGANNSQQS